MTKQETMKRAAQDKRTAHHSLNGHGGLDGFRSRLDDARRRNDWPIPERRHA